MTLEELSQTIGRLQAQIVAQSNDLISLQKNIQALEASVKLNPNTDKLTDLESRLTTRINALKQELTYRIEVNQGETTEWIEKTVKNNKVSFWDFFKK